MDRPWCQEGEENQSCGTAGLTMSEADVIELCKLGLPRLKSMVRPDTNRVGEAFDNMMTAVKRRSQTRHMDMNTAVERCFTTFAGRGHGSVSVHEFAEKLSVLSMQWSGNFSLEDHLALAETLSEEDDPHLITIESFSSAVSVGSQVVGALRDERGSREARARQEGGRAGASSGMRADGDETTNASDKCDRIATAGEDVDVQSCTGCDVVEFGDDGGGFGRRRGDCSRQPAAAWEATLERAAAEARSDGQDVWQLLDSTTRRTTKIPEEVGHGSVFAGATAATILTPELLHRFLTKLDVCVLKPPVPDHTELKAPPLTTTMIYERDAEKPSDDSAKRYEHEAARGIPFNDATQPAMQNKNKALFEARQSSRLQKGVAPREDDGQDDGGGEGLTMGDIYCGMSRSTSDAAQEGRGRAGAGGGGIGGRGMMEGPPAASDRYLRQLSRDSASLRCRVQQCNGELARTTREAENLFSSSRNTNARLRPSSPSVSDDARGSRVNCVDGRERGVLGGCGTFYDDEGKSTVTNKAYRASSTPTGAGCVAVRGGGPPCLVREVPRGSGQGPTVIRMTPLERADPSHPRVDVPRASPIRVRSRGGSELPRRPFSSAALNPAHHVTDTHRCRQSRTPPRSVWSTGAGDRRCGRSNAAREEREGMAMLLLATLRPMGGNFEAESTSPAASEVARFLSTAYDGPAPTQNEEVVTRFDPPSVRNGLAGLTTTQVDSVLLRVDGATPGSQSCWKPTEKGGSFLELNQQRQRQRRRRQHLQRDAVGRERRWPGLTPAASWSREARGWAGVPQVRRVVPDDDDDDDEEEEEEGKRGRGWSSSVVVGGEAPTGKAVKQRSSGSSKKTEKTWEQMKRVIKTPRSARPLPWERRNVWDAERMKWINRASRHSEGGGFKILPPATAGARTSKGAEGDGSGGRGNGSRAAQPRISTKLHRSS